MCAFPPFFHSTYSGGSCWYLCYRCRCRPHRGCLLFFMFGLSLEHSSQNCWRLHQKRICFYFVIVIHFSKQKKKIVFFVCACYAGMCALCVCVSCPIWVAFVHRFNFNASNFVLCTYRWPRQCVQIPNNCIKQWKFIQQMWIEGTERKKIWVSCLLECAQHTNVQNTIYWQWVNSKSIQSNGN